MRFFKSDFKEYSVKDDFAIIQDLLNHLQYLNNLHSLMHSIHDGTDDWTFDEDDTEEYIEQFYVRLSHDIKQVEIQIQLVHHLLSHIRDVEQNFYFSGLYIQKFCK